MQTVCARPESNIITFIDCVFASAMNGLDDLRGTWSYRVLLYLMEYYSRQLGPCAKQFNPTLMFIYHKRHLRSCRDHFRTSYLKNLHQAEEMYVVLSNYWIVY